MRPIHRLLILMSDFGEKLPASTVVYALAVMATVAFAAWR